jgi:hypothetical protein
MLCPSTVLPLSPVLESERAECYESDQMFDQPFFGFGNSALQLFSFPVASRLVLTSTAHSSQSHMLISFEAGRQATNLVSGQRHSHTTITMAMCHCRVVGMCLSQNVSCNAALLHCWFCSHG